MSNTYEQLSKLDNTIQDAGLYQGQVGVVGHAQTGSSA
jgi:ubiquitin carboxyl-terminal hydrolase 4/11/15